MNELKLEISGPYRRNGPGQLADMDLDIRASAGDHVIKAGLITNRDNAWLEWDGTTYEIGKDAVAKYLGEQKARRQQGHQKLNALDIKPVDWLREIDVTNGLSDGVETDHIIAEVEVDDLLVSLQRFFNDSILADKLGTLTLSAEDKQKIEQAITMSNVSIDIGEDDYIFRRADLQADFTVPADMQDNRHGITGGRVSLVLAQTHVNDGQVITPPKNAKPFLDLWRTLGDSLIDKAFESGVER
jgi:hypothetical protein